MLIAIAIFGVAFAAFCVWFGVRIFNRRERWAKWTAVGLVALFVGYPLSIGPVVWLASRDYAPPWVCEKYALPLLGVFELAFPAIPEPLQEPLYYAITGYVHLWIPATVPPVQ
jgi:hypothetical protein